ncbi:MAG: hypothetical protein HGA75_09290, partial [Thiobacillus sp.]|nr:hypothetical protein [Thiobacillus sp.]
MRAVRRFGLFLLVFLAGCASLDVTMAPESLRGLKPVNQFKLDGRLSVKSDGQRFSGSITWQRGEAEETLLLSGPLGQGAAHRHPVRGGQALGIGQPEPGEPLDELVGLLLLARAAVLRP